MRLGLHLRNILLSGVGLCVSACSVLPNVPSSLTRWMKGHTSHSPTVASRVGTGDTVNPANQAPNETANEVVLFALGLMETDYRFGGKNPEAGLDCSGMVSYVFRNTSPLRLDGSAADQARLGRPVGRTQLRPGDLVFFSTPLKSFAHVGIYIGDDRFVHAPNSGGKVRTESLSTDWYSAHFEEGRSYFD